MKQKGLTKKQTERLDKVYDGIIRECSEMYKPHLDAIYEKIRKEELKDADEEELKRFDEYAVQVKKNLLNAFKDGVVYTLNNLPTYYDRTYLAVHPESQMKS